MRKGQREAVSKGSSPRHGPLHELDVLLARLELHPVPLRFQSDPRNFGRSRGRVQPRRGRQRVWPESNRASACWSADVAQSNRASVAQRVLVRVEPRQRVLVRRRGAVEPRQRVLVRVEPRQRVLVRRRGAVEPRQRVLVRRCGAVPIARRSSRRSRKGRCASSPSSRAVARRARVRGWGSAHAPSGFRLARERRGAKVRGRGGRRGTEPRATGRGSGLDARAPSWRVRGPRRDCRG
jgi:hypothetical protein